MKGSQVQYNPDSHPAIYLRFNSTGPLITIYRTGKFNITAANSIREASESRDKLIRCLSELGVISENTDNRFEIVNCVAIDDLKSDIELAELAIILGLERTEYEPEQFPGLIYRQNGPCVLLIFASGKVVITGGKSKEDAQDSFNELMAIVSD